MFCKFCGSELVDDAIFCSNCGEKISKDLPPKFCVGCGAELDDDSVFCSNCGKKIRLEENKAGAASSSQRKEGRGVKKQSAASNKESVSSSRKSQKEKKDAPDCWTDFYVNNKHFVYLNDSEVLYCPNCHNFASPDDTLCPYCNHQFIEVEVKKGKNQEPPIIAQVKLRSKEEEAGSGAHLADMSKIEGVRSESAWGWVAFIWVVIIFIMILAAGVVH